MANSNHNNSNFMRIVYTKVKTNGQTELVPLKLYTDFSVEEINSLPSVTTTETAMPLETLINNRYLIRRVLGQGGFGRTYLASDLHCFNEPCVLKEFLPTGAEDYQVQKSRALFEREAKILYQIEHPQIPKFLACFEDTERLFLAQEYIKGKTYSTLLRERLAEQGQAFSEAEVTQWLKDLLPVLDYIHQHNIIHRDISPDNVMLLHEKNLPILIDFGVGKQTIGQLQSQDFNGVNNSNPVSLVSNVSCVGKIGYAPREQIYMGHCSPSSDLYALGVTAVVLLTGKSPEVLMDGYSLEWQWRNYAQVSPGLAQILNKLLADKPKDRYQSAKDVLADFQLPISPLSTLPSLTSPQVTVVSQAPKAKVVNQPPNETNNIAKQSSLLNFAFVERCQQELTNYIGPIASFLVKEVLSQNTDLSTQMLVDALVAKIPDSQQAIEFRRRLL